MKKARFGRYLEDAELVAQCLWEIVRYENNKRFTELVLAGKHDRAKALKPSLEWCLRSDGN